jgi:hypothetical protein
MSRRRLEMFPEADYYLGWMIQPIWADYFYVYDRDDSARPNKGYYVKGSKEDAMQFIENKIKKS